MLSEEALILIGAFLALGLLVLGIWELVWPSRPRHPERRPQAGARAGSVARRLPRPASTPAQPPAPGTRAPGLVDPPLPAAAEAAAAPRERGAPEAIDRRLWRSYTNLGLRQIEEGKFESALDPLFQALRLPVAPEQVFETRVALVRAFEGVVDEASTEIRALVAANDRARAELRVEKLWTALRSGIEQGVPQHDLDELLGRTQRLFEEIGQ
jgi:hypothetical protein